MRILRRSLILLGMSLLCVAASAIYTPVQLNTARARGVYSSPEQGMIARADKYYSADRQVKIIYASRGYCAKQITA